jgi:tetratricopeptide (TPR) repeat protein
VKSKQILWLLILPLVLCAAARVDARGARERRARALFKRAEVHFNVQEFGQALKLYRRAYKLKPLPGFLLNIGQCQRHMGRYRKALFSYKVYLERLPNAPNRPQVERLIERVKRQQATAEAPRPRQPVPAAPPERPLFEVSDVGAPGSEQPDDGEGGRSAVLLWSGVGLTAALLTTGVVTGQLASDRAAEYRDPGTSVPDRHELKDSVAALSTTSAVTFSLAGVAAVGTALYYLMTAGQESAVSAAVAPLPGGGAALSIGGEL